MKPLSYRLGNIELRTVDSRLSIHLTDLEIVQWGLDACWTIASWKRHKEGFDLVFVTNRPFHKDVDKLDFFKLAEVGQEYLTEEK